MVLNGFYKTNNSEFKKFKIKNDLKKTNSNYDINFDLGEQINIEALNFKTNPKKIGNIKKLPKRIRGRLKESVNLTRKCKKILVNLAINYGSKDEIIESIRLMKSKKQNISKKNFEMNLYTRKIPDPDLLIRTGGKRRLSNFLLWQLAYSELYFLDKLLSQKW